MIQPAESKPEKSNPDETENVTSSNPWRACAAISRSSFDKKDQYEQPWSDHSRAVHRPLFYKSRSRAPNWDDLNERFPSNSITRMLEGITALDNDELVAEVAAFLAEHPVPQAGKQVEQHQERQRINAALRRRETPRLEAALGD